MLKNVLFLGLGAVGASIASQFADADYPISVLCDITRKERYKQNGFIINNKRYDFSYYTPDEYHLPVDLIIIAVKYNNLRDAIKQLKGLVGEKTIRMSLLNGIDSEEIIAEYSGNNNIVPSFIYKIDATKTNNVVTHFSKGIIVFGEKTGNISTNINLIKEIFDRAVINYEVSGHIVKRMWWKYMANIGLNQATAVLRAPYEVIQKVAYAQELARLAMEEVVLISKVMEINLSEKDIDGVMEMSRQLHPDGKSSMLQDVEAKRKTEVEMLSGKLCQLGEQYHISTPINKMFYNLIKSIENMY
ncbi:MAG: 2-dehydropantoate 2-reductase [Candidatus Caldatribacteriota bacterium]